MMVRGGIAEAVPQTMPKTLLPPSFGADSEQAALWDFMVFSVELFRVQISFRCLQ